MSFLFPLGLLGLIGIPIVIIIYILQSKYNEQTVTSTYIWHLSDKFLKKKNPFSGLTGLISLLLQILTIAAISLAIARPIFVLPNAAYDYCFILDVSGSMNMKNGSKTRFELAKDEIVELIEESADGSSYTLVTVSSGETLVFEDVTSKDSAIDAVENLSPGSESHSHTVMFTTAQNCLNKNASEEDTNPKYEKLYLVTDKRYGETANVNIIDVSGSNVENYALFDLQGTQAGGKLTATGKLLSHLDDAELEIKLYVDDSKKAATSKSVPVKKGVAKSFEIECLSESYTSFTVEITNADAYKDDNRVTSYNLKSESKIYRTLIVSETDEYSTGFYFKAALDATSDLEFETVSYVAYESDPEKYKGYGLYVFDSYTPKALPDGAVWLINATTSIPGSGFNAKGKQSVDPAKKMVKSTSSKTSTRKLLEGVDGSNIYISEYVKYSGFYLKYETLFSYNNYPLIFTSENETGNRQVVMGFDIYKSDFAATVDFVILVGNLVEYCFPDVVDKANYTVGEEALINVLPNAENIKAYDPTGKELYVDASNTTALLNLTKIGTYTIKMQLSGIETTYKIYSAANKEESDPNQTEENFLLTGELSRDKRDGFFDPVMILFICAAVLFIADWGVYCYEKYQLR